MTDEEVLFQFETLGMSASFHYADDTTGEWRLGGVCEDKARKLLKENPHLESKMQELAKRFLWSL